MSQYESTEKYSYQKINRFFVEKIPQLPTPIINNRPNCITVGPYRVITNGKNYEVWQGRKHLYDFLSRSWGVGYALCLYRNSISIASHLQDMNEKYSKLSEEVEVYKHHMNIANKRSDATKYDMFRCRLSRVENEIFSLESTANGILKNIQLG